MRLQRCFGSTAAPPCLPGEQTCYFAVELLSSFLIRMLRNCTVIGGPAWSWRARTPDLSALSLWSMHSAVVLPLILWRRWLPLAMMTYWFQSSDLIDFWRSSELIGS